MEWSVHYDPSRKGKSWGVYRHADGRRFFESRFETEEEARYYAEKKEKRHAHPHGDKLGKVDEASFESFPASDPPGWIKVAARPDTQGKRTRH